MFAAAHIDTGEQVVILDPQWQENLTPLRTLCAADRLICPVCRQPLWTRAGEKRRWHFAHKHLSDCPSTHDSPELLQARAVLYEWLLAKFGTGAVQMEKTLGAVDGAFSRPFDCVAETPKGVKLAFWVFDRRATPDERDAIRAAVESSEHALVPVFTASVMRRNESREHTLTLSTTEREFMVQTDYDSLYPGFTWTLGSLHYLDGENETLTTFRTMTSPEPPQQYAGTEISTPMGEVSIHGPTGQFVHPGEWDRLREHQQRVAEEKRREAARREREEQMRREREGRAATVLAERQKVWASIGIRKDVPPCKMRVEREARLAAAPPPSPQSSIFEGHNFPCEVCGAMTPERDRIIFNAKTGLCKCRACVSRG